MAILRFILKNTFRHKLRTVLTIAGIAVAILSFGLLRTVINAWYAGVEASSATRLVTRNAISLVFFLPRSYKEKIRQVPGVKQVGYSYWFGGVYIDEKNFFPSFATDASTAMDLFPEFLIPEDQKRTFMRERKGAVVGRKTAERFGWKLGDTVTLRGTIFPGNWDFVIRGIYRGAQKSTDETQFFFHWDYLNESIKRTYPGSADKVGWFLVGVTGPEKAAEVSAAIDALFKNSMAETLTETEKAFQMGFVAMSEAIIIAIQAVSLVVIIIILAVTANTMAMSARERTGEYAVLKTLGFGARHIAALIFGESFLITMAGCLLGVLGTFPAADAFGRAMGNFLPVFNISSLTIGLDVLFSLVVALVAGIIPAYRAVTVPIAQGLRKIV